MPITVIAPPRIQGRRNDPAAVRRYGPGPVAGRRFAKGCLRCEPWHPHDVLHGLQLGFFGEERGSLNQNGNPANASALHFDFGDASPERTNAKSSHSFNTTNLRATDVTRRAKTPQLLWNCNAMRQDTRCHYAILRRAPVKRRLSSELWETHADFPFLGFALLQML